MRPVLAAEEGEAELAEVKPGAVTVKPVGEGHAPAGTPVSTALDMAGIPRTARSPFGVKVRGAVRTIDSVHGDGQLSQITVKATQSRTRWGAYVSRWDDTPVRIDVSRKGDHQRLTVAHEVGHFLDHQGLGGMGFETDRATREGSLLNPWWKAVSGSDAFGDLEELGRERVVVVGTSPSGADLTYRVDTRYLGYLKSERELFARSYSQYVASNGEDAEMRAELEEARKPAGERQFRYPTQWSDEDFEPIGRALDELFRSLGWLK